MSQVITSLRHLPGDHALGLLTTHFTYRDYNRSSERIPGWRIYGLLQFEAPPSRPSPQTQISALHDSYRATTETQPTDEYKNISTACYSFARGGPRASATSTHRPLPQPETKARQRSRQQRRRRVELGSNATCCPCSSPILRSGGWATTVDSTDLETLKV